MFSMVVENAFNLNPLMNSISVIGGNYLAERPAVGTILTDGFNEYKVISVPFAHPAPGVSYEDMKAEVVLDDTGLSPEMLLGRKLTERSKLPSDV
jgi:hypothetical protein